MNSENESKTVGKNPVDDFSITTGKMDVASLSGNMVPVEKKKPRVYKKVLQKKYAVNGIFFIRKPIEIRKPLGFVDGSQGIQIIVKRRFSFFFFCLRLEVLIYADKRTWGRFEKEYIIEEKK